MKYTLLFQVFATFALCGCGGNKSADEAKARFYLSQPRDSELVGWWEDEKPSGDDFSYYTCFNADGTAWHCHRDFNGKLWRNPYCWYAKDGMYHLFERPSSYIPWKGVAAVGSEWECEYEIRGNERWEKQLDGWRAAGKRTTPQQ